MISNIYIILLIFSLFAGVVKYKQLSKPLKLVFLFVVIGCLTELSSEILKEFGLRNTMPVGNVYMPVSLIVLGIFYLFLLKDYIDKKIIIGLIVAFAFLCIANLIFIQDINKFPNITASIGALVIVVFSVLQFSKVMTETKIEKLSAEPLIWINSAFLIYYSANFFFFILYNINVEKNLEFILQIYPVYGVFNLLLYALISIGFLKVKKQGTQRMA